MFSAKPLPYPMGNIGDLIKHGLLAEYLNWRLELEPKKLHFFDPFGGRPWLSPVTGELKQRIDEIQSGALIKLQNNSENRYYGSGHIARKISAGFENLLQVRVSDRDADARSDLEKSGLELIQLPHFHSNDAYSILCCGDYLPQNSIILLDPFYELEHINQQVLKAMMRLIKDYQISVLLFVLYRHEAEVQWQKFLRLQRELRPENTCMVGIQHQELNNIEVLRKSSYFSFIGLYLPINHEVESFPLFIERVEQYTEKLASVLSTKLKLLRD